MPWCRRDPRRPGQPAEPVSPERLEIYKAVRTHEVMLNEARAELERGVLAPLVTLNGGAVVAFLTLLGALSGKESGLKPNYWWAGGAIVVWLVGLLLAALAVTSASEHQGKLNESYRLMREIVEGKLDKKLAAIVARDAKTPETRQCDRKRALEASERAAKSRTRLWKGSAGAFLIGAALALVSVLVGVNGESALVTKTTVTTSSTKGAPATVTTTIMTTRTGTGRAP